MSGFLGSLISDVTSPQAIAGIGGALIGANAVSGAANTAANANVQAAQIQANDQAAARAAFQGAATQGEGFIDTGSNNYASTIAPLLTQNPITLPSYRDLTTQQQIGEQQLMRNGQASLAASGLRGAGRAGVASLMDADAQYQAGARAGNDATNLQAQQTAQQTQNSARTGLANVQAAAGTAKANTAIGAGSQIGGSYQQQGATGANLASQTGQIQGAAQIGVGNNAAAALGSVTGYANSPNSGYYGMPLGAMGGLPSASSGNGSSAGI